jgi:UPF0755 protein
MARQRRKSRRNSKFSASGTLLVLFLVLLVAAGAAAWLVFAPFGPRTETFVDLAPGSSTFRIGQQLESVGVVRSQFAFDLVRIWKRGTLEAGEYRFDQPASVREVYARIQRGDVYTVAVIVPEGSTIFDIAARLEQAGLGTKREFLDEQAKQTGLVVDLDPGAKSLEGYLFPDTYRFTRKATPSQITAAMVKRFRQVSAQLELKENVHEVVTMASLIERETAVDGERRLVASVFENRLAKHMPLMTDPSVIYGLQLDGLWSGAIHAKDLKRDTPYNTYIHTGMPPGPVANPGIRSLRAAMDPAHTEYLYFVAAGANPQGQSMFANTLEEHDRNVTGYRHALKKAGSR